MAENASSSSSESDGGSVPTMPSLLGPSVALSRACGKPALFHPTVATVSTPTQTPGAPGLVTAANSSLMATGVVSGLRVVVLHRHNGDFGFTLRHFIVYPPDSVTSSAAASSIPGVGLLNFVHPMDTVFVKKVHPNTPAYLAGLQEGDRLLAVNGVPVTAMPYSQVVATIQQTPKTLTLQVVPKNFDILQTFFSETAHNPETNQRRPQPQTFAPKVQKPKPKPPFVPLTVEGVQEKQESLYSTLQEIVSENGKGVGGALEQTTKQQLPTIYADVPKALVSTLHQVPHIDPTQQQQQQQQLQPYRYLQKQQQHPYQVNQAGPTGQSKEDNAIMSRLRRSLEQKEEFLRRPLMPPPQPVQQDALGGVVVKEANRNSMSPCGDRDVLQREFYGRPNRLQKSVWPPAAVSPPPNVNGPPALVGPPTLPPMSPSAVPWDVHTPPAPAIEKAGTFVGTSHASNLSAIRELFFTGDVRGALGVGGSGGSEPLGTASPLAGAAPAGDDSFGGPGAGVPLSPYSMHVVSEKAKLFESGRPLSPEGIDRMDLYKSEISRINTKQVAPNVAVRRREFELKAEGTGWGRPTADDRTSSSVCSDSDSQRTPVRVRSLSAETNPSPQEAIDKFPTTAPGPPPGGPANEVVPVAPLRQHRAHRNEDSHRNAICSSTAFWLQGPGSLALRSEPLTAVSGPAVHRLRPSLSEATGAEQSKLKLMHRNHTIVEVLGAHYEPRLSLHAASHADAASAASDLTAAAAAITPAVATDHCHGSPPLAPRVTSFPSSKDPSTIGRSLHVFSTDDQRWQAADSAAAAAPGSHHQPNGFYPGPAVRMATLEVSTDGPGSASPVVLRQKQHHHGHQQLHEDDERKMRRISYLRATASDNLFQLMDAEGVAEAVDTPPVVEVLPVESSVMEVTGPGSAVQRHDSVFRGDHDEHPILPPPVKMQTLPATALSFAGSQPPTQLKSSAFRPWRRPHFTNDIQPLRRLFDSDSGDTAPAMVHPASEPGVAVVSARLRLADPAPQSDPSAIAKPSPPRAPVSYALESRTASSGGGMRLVGSASSLGSLHVVTMTMPGGQVMRNYFFAPSHGAKSKALSHFRDEPADASEPLLRAGELYVKVTVIDGKRSVDRSWRQVHAELRGTRLKLLLVREGKSSLLSPEPSGTIDLTNFHVSEGGKQTKRKNVIRLATTFGSYCPLEAAAAASATSTTSFPNQPQQQHQQQQQRYVEVPSTSGLAVAPSDTGTGACAEGSGSAEREILLQADSSNEVAQWMELLRNVCSGKGSAGGSNLRHPVSHRPDYSVGGGGQQAEPQRVAAQTSVQVQSVPTTAGGASSGDGDGGSPILPTKPNRKYALGARSPSGQSPVTKSRKTPPSHARGTAEPASESDPPLSPYAGRSQGTQAPLGGCPLVQQSLGGSGGGGSDRENGSPKSKTWKGIVARQFRKMQGQPASPPSQQQQELVACGASINVPLPLCPMSEEHPYVPLVLAKCTAIVESKGLAVVGIYRIPGNTAAITHLTETVNRGLDEVSLQDPRWEDVNVVSSLLKSFIRNLPEPLLPNALYGGFIGADKLGGQKRLIELRALLHRIPPLNYATLKHLMRHLHRVSTHSEINLMDPRNLAIVFGPSVVRSANESLETAVKDMRHQCQIVEVLINYYQYFFEDALLPAMDEKMISASAVESAMEVPPTTTLLLDNVSKLEPFKDSSSSAKEGNAGFVANIVQAANRKIRRTAQRKSVLSSTTPDTLSLDSTTSAESKEQSLRSITRNRAVPRRSPAAVSGGGRGSLSEDSVTVAHTTTGAMAEESLLQLHHHHHHHHHYYHSNRHHSAQSNDDASSLLNRSSEDDSNDSAFADNGSMSLKTVTIALDNKLRSLRNTSINSSDPDAVLESDGELSSGCSASLTAPSSNGQQRRHSLHQKYHISLTARPLTLGGENIPYADESPERRPPNQGRAGPVLGAADDESNTTKAHCCTESKTISSGNDNDNNGNSTASTNITTNSSSQSAGQSGTTTGDNNNGDNGSGAATCEAHSTAKPGQPLSATVKKATVSPHPYRPMDSGSDASSNNSSTNASCLTLVNEVSVAAERGEDDGGLGSVAHDAKKLLQSPEALLSSDETDSSTTSNPCEKRTAAAAPVTAPYRIDTEVLKKMNRILTQLERKANNLERKFNLNRSLSLNYKTTKAVDCCCGHHDAGPMLAALSSHTAPLPQPHCFQAQQLMPAAGGGGPACHGSTGCMFAGGGGCPPLSLRSRLSLTKDEKTDKNINRRRQIHDIHATTGGSSSGGLGCLVTATAASSSSSNGSSATSGSSSSSSSSSGSSSSNSSNSSYGEPVTVGPLAPVLPAAASGPGAASSRHRRHGSRSIRRRHTVGGTHDYLSNKMNPGHQHHHHHHHHLGHPDCCPVPRN
ncbi:uncharacterized protein LOC131213485 [Anopheles bellator]|uniref:uncharacterized protein LOC131213485 n=1 Tax=Anopheles bellator TaxID=139047 RepID=UPI0026498941|nr:uncharacterized protein LOC131213485 [Anopheles bellator]